MYLSYRLSITSTSEFRVFHFSLSFCIAFASGGNYFDVAPFWLVLNMRDSAQSKITDVELLTSSVIRPVK